MRAGFRLVLEKPLEDGALLEGITNVTSRTDSSTHRSCPMLSPTTS